MIQMNNQSVLSSFHVNGFDEHNRSLDWIEDTANKIGAEINLNTEARWTKYSESFEIKFNGRDSGIIYKITISQSDKQTKFLAKRFHEIDLNERNAKIIMKAFPEIMHYDIHWFDIRTSEWSGVCMEAVREKSRPYWPGDEIVSIMYALYDDFRSCLDENMYTLRRVMSNALVTYWFAEVMPGGYPFDYSIDQVCEFLEYLELLQKTSKEEYQDLFENTLTLSIFETAEKIQRYIGGHGE